MKTLVRYTYLIAVFPWRWQVMNALFVTLALLLGAIWAGPARADSILEVQSRDLLEIPSTRWWVIQEIMTRESRFLAPGIGYDIATGAPFDGWLLDYDTGYLLGPPRNWSSPSKDYQQLLILALAIAGNSLAQQALVPNDPVAARALALEILATKMTTYERFYTEFGGFGGCLPWYVIENGRIKPSDSRVPSGNWERRSAGLDVGEFLTAMLMTAHVLRQQGEVDLADHYQVYFDQTIQNAVTIFLDRSVMKLRAEAAIQDPQGAVVPSNYSTLGSGFLDDPYEGQMLLLMAVLFGGLSAEDATTLWANSHLERLDTVVDGQGFSLRLGYWFSSHEQFPWLILPLDDCPTAKAVFVLGERARTRFAAAEGELLAASCNPPVPRTLRDYIDPSYLSNLGIPGLGSQLVQRGVWTDYAPFSVIMAQPDTGLAWLHATMKMPKMWGPYGFSEAYSETGWVPCLTWDGKALPLIALASSYASPSAPELTKAALQALGKYDQYVQLLEGKYTAVFEAPLVGEEVAFGLPNAQPPSQLPGFIPQPATENLLERRFDTTALPGVIVNRDAGAVSFSSAGGYIWAPTPETDISQKPILTIRYQTTTQSLVWLELKNGSGEVIAGQDMPFPNAPHIKKIGLNFPNTSGQPDSLQLDLRPVLHQGVTDKVTRVLAFSDPRGSAELTYLGLADASATHLKLEVLNRVVSGEPFQVWVKALDLSDNVVRTFGDQVSLQLANSGGSLSGTLTALAVNGVATFADLSYQATADKESFTLSADDQSGVGPDLPAVSAPALVSEVVATQLVFTVQPGRAIHGQPLGVQPVVEALDANGVRDLDFSGAVTLAPAAGGILAGPLTVTAVNGLATFAGLILSEAGTRTLGVTAGGMSPAISAPFTVARAPASIILTSLEVPYDGQPKSVGITTAPPGLLVGVTYNGSGSPPVAVGTYEVLATINDPNFEGSAKERFTISQPATPPVGTQPGNNPVDTGSGTSGNKGNPLNPAPPPPTSTPPPDPCAGTPHVVLSTTLQDMGRIAVGSEREIQVNFTNTGTGCASLHPNISSGQNRGWFSFSPSEITLKANMSENLLIRFKPQGNEFAKVLFLIGDLELVVQGEGIFPEPVFSCAVQAIDFGPIPIQATEVQERSLVIRNPGTALLDFTVSSSNEAVFAVASDKVSVPVGDSTTVIIQFHPQRGPANGQLVFHHNAGSSPFVVELHGTGVDLEPPAPPQELRAVVIADSVLLSWNPSPDSDHAGYHLYRGGASATQLAKNVNMLMLPLAVGTSQFKVTAIDSSGNESNAAEVEVVREALVVDPMVQASPQQVVMANTQLGQQSEQSVSIQSRAKRLLLLTFKITGLDSTQFSVSGSNRRALRPGQVISLPVAFSPTGTPGNRTASLDILSGNNSIAVVALAGVAAAAPPPPAVQVSAKALVFDPVAVGGSVEQTLLLKNMNSKAVILSLKVEGDSTQFRITGRRRLTLSRGQEVKVKVVFEPLAAGSKRTSLLITAVSNSVPVVVALRGTALPARRAAGKEASVAASVPGAITLEANYPNPFNPETTIGYQLPAAAHVRLEIYDVLGQKVRTLVQQVEPAGYHNAMWDGRDDGGRALAGGVYFYRLQAGEFSQTRKLLLMK